MGKLTPFKQAFMVVSSVLDGSINRNESPGKDEFADRYDLPHFQALQSRDEMEAEAHVVYTSSN